MSMPATGAATGTVALVGGGAMGEALLAGLLRNGIGPVVVAERRPERAAELRETYPSARILDNATAIPDAVAEARTVLVVVKPGDVAAAIDEIAPALRAGSLVVSVAAGVTTSTIESHLPDGVAVVRVMPNTPALVGEGMAAVSAGAHATDDDLARVEQLLAATGRVVRVPEELQDAVTAVSGSGPAYVFALVEAMVAAGTSLGLDATTARELAAQTVVGAGVMLRDTGADPATLRRNVTSPHGTTAAALAVLEERGVSEAYLAALTAARDRSRELSGG